MSNDVNAAYEYLFAALRGLRDGSMDVTTARAISDVSRTVVEVAKVEIAFSEATGREAYSSLLSPAAAPALPGRIVHRIKG